MTLGSPAGLSTYLKFTHFTYLTITNWTIFSHSSSNESQSSSHDGHDFTARQAVWKTVERDCELAEKQNDSAVFKMQEIMKFEEAAALPSIRRWR